MTDLNIMTNTSYDISLSPVAQHLSEQMEQLKTVLILNPELPVGVMANAAGVLAMSLAKQLPQLVGDNFQDQQQQTHLGITQYALPVLTVPLKELNTLRQTLFDYQDQMLVVDLSDATRRTRSYQDYQMDLAALPAEQVVYQGIALCGPKRLVNRFTGHLPLLR